MVLRLSFEKISNCNLTEVGTYKRSQLQSRYFIEKMRKQVDFSKLLTLADFGSWTRCLFI